MKRNLKNIFNFIIQTTNLFTVSATVWLVWYSLIFPTMGYTYLIIPLLQIIWLSSIVISVIRKDWVYE